MSIHSTRRHLLGALGAGGLALGAEIGRAHV